MDKLLVSNIYFNIILPSFIAGVFTLGIVHLLGNTKISIILSGMLGFSVGILIKNNFKWEIKSNSDERR